MINAGDKVVFVNADNYPNSSLLNKEGIVTKAWNFKFEVRSNKFEERQAFFVKFANDKGEYMVSFQDIKKV